MLVWYLPGPHSVQFTSAGIPVPAGKVLDGESLLPLIKGEGALTRPAIFWHFPGYIDNPVNRGRELDVRTGFRSRPVTVIRKGDWKLVKAPEEGAGLVERGGGASRGGSDAPGPARVRA